MEQFVKDQITYGMKYLPINWLKSYFIKKDSQETREFRKRGFICGVCHPSKDFEQIKAANIGWVRIDIPYPYDRNGQISEAYLHFKEWALTYKNNGMKVMAVTPYPKIYIANGVDVRTIEGEKKVREIARFLIGDMQGVADGFQITNEMGMPHFTLPLTMEEAVRFIGVNLEEMYELRGDIIVGYNSLLVQADLHCKMKPYYQYCDYVGVDIYVGCFGRMGGYLWFYEAILRYLWAFTGKPILIQEFGYISGGEPKSRAKKNAMLQAYGFRDEEDVKAHIEAFVELLPDDLRKHTKYVCANNTSHYFKLLFHSDLVNHLYCELPKETKIPGYPHTSEGQEKFFRDVLKRVGKLNFVCGAFVYCYCDSKKCYICGQKNCPVETRWGLVDGKGVPKPSYYAVQKAFGKLKSGI